MNWTERSKWDRGEVGAMQRLAFALRHWMHERGGLSLQSAVKALSEDTRWPRDVNVPVPTGLQNFSGLESDPYPQAKRLPGLRVFWALCECLDISAEWVLLCRGAMAKDTKLTAAEFETELAVRVLREMPRDEPQSGGLSQHLAVVGAACLTAAVDAAKADWARARERSGVFAALREAEMTARAYYSSDVKNPSRVKAYTQLKARLAVVAASFRSPEISTLRQYPLESDYTEPSVLPGSHPSETDVLYCYAVKCPSGHATRSGRSWRTPLRSGEQKAAKKALFAQQQREEAERVATLAAAQDATPSLNRQKRK